MACDGVYRMVLVDETTRGSYNSFGANSLNGWCQSGVIHVGLV
jgi:hypothetical protein